MDIKKRKIIYLLSFAILGFAIANQNRNVEVREPLVAVRDKIEQKQNMLHDERLKRKFWNEKLKEELDLRKNYLESYGDFFKEELIKQWDEARLKAGFVKVSGEGVVIRLSDVDVDISKDYNNFIVHDKDIIKILNELKIAGAQAISVNGERILSTSEIICTGPTVQINRNRYPAPFKIKAIGESEIIYDKIIDSNIIKELLMLGFELDISIEERLEISGFTGDINRVVRGLEDLI